MPRRSKFPCRHRGCGRLVDRPGYCEIHAHEAHSAKRNDNRARQANRALKTSSKAWRKLRESFLRRNPLCVICESEGRITPAAVVDHIDGNAWDNSEQNLQPLCASCHSRKTAREDGGFGNTRK